MRKFIPSRAAIIVFCVTLGTGVSSYAQRVPINEVETTTLSNLIRESESLSIINEGSVQIESRESKRTYSLKLGIVDQSSLSIEGKSETYDYALGQESPVLGASFSVVPWKRVIDGGLDLSISYLTQEGLGEVSREPAQLHVLFFEPSLFVQREIKELLVPRLGVGVGLAALFQRGFEDENTSTSKGYGFGYAALDFNISRTEWFKSELDWALSLEHRRSFGQKSSVAVNEIQKTVLGFALRL